jgi:hypothetical protein
MNAISTIALITDLLDAFEAVFPKATTLAHAAAVTNIVSAAAVATQAVSGPVDPTVAAIGNSLPVVVASVQAVRTAVVASTSTSVAA